MAKKRIIEFEQRLAEYDPPPHGLLGFQDQLAHSQKQEVLSSLTGGVIHDINNILHCILGRTESALLFTSEDDPSYTTLKEIETIVLKGRDLAESYLSFGRNSPGNPVPLKLNQVITEVKNLLLHTTSKMIRIDYHLAKKLHPILGDGSQCEQVVMNLCINSIDATPNGGRVEIRTENIIITPESKGVAEFAIPPGSYVRLSVKDNGCGIPPKAKQNIFTPFFSTKAKGQGTGLGLSVVQSIVLSHGGHITCQSEENEGTLFHVYFPRFVFGTKAAETRQHCKTVLQPPEKKRIMIVEDEQMVLDIMKRLLEHHDYSVMIAERAEEGLEHCQEAPVDLVIMDIGLPGMGGYELYQRLKSLRPLVKILVISGNVNLKNIINGEKRSLARFLAKPFTHWELLKQVQSMLDEQPEAAGTN